MSKESEKRISRRAFVGIGAAGVAAAGGLGWLARRAYTGASKPEMDPSFIFDVSQYEHTDPKLLLCREVAHIPTGMTVARRVAVGPEDRVYVAGDRAVKVFDKNGQSLLRFALAGTPLALFADHDGHMHVGFQDYVASYDEKGRLIRKTAPLGANTCVTSVAVSGHALYIADAGNREVIHCKADGTVVKRFGKLNPAASGEGFVIPSPYFDLRVGADDLLRVANTGRHRIETYTPDGELENVWGSESMNIAGFCGCCNPAHFTMLGDGRIVTSEKGLNRIKIYSEEGHLQGVVAGPEELLKDAELAQRACADCRIGFAYDVATDSQGRVLALDPCTQGVRVFARTAGKTSAASTVT